MHVDLFPELWLRILKRLCTLQPQIILRFRLVSKCWLTLINFIVFQCVPNSIRIYRIHGRNFFSNKTIPNVALLYWNPRTNDTQFVILSKKCDECWVEFPVYKITTQYCKIIHFPSYRTFINFGDSFLNRSGTCSLSNLINRINTLFHPFDEHKKMLKNAVSVCQRKNWIPSCDLESMISGEVVNLSIQYRTFNRYFGHMNFGQILEPDFEGSLILNQILATFKKQIIPYQPNWVLIKLRNDIKRNL